MIGIKEFLLKPKNYDIEDENSIFIVDQCPGDIDPFLKKFNEKFYFTLERSVKFYKWRIDRYPLGEKNILLKKYKIILNQF